MGSKVFSPSEWEGDVRDALALGEPGVPVLANLYREAVEGLGNAEASRLWLEIMSGFDASAVTG